ncbi:MAG: AI-2E family transporter [Myxococcota bacterium]|nr:AI-2E family transporter [Myxococcota bacterium]
MPRTPSDTIAPPASGATSGVITTPIPTTQTGSTTRSRTATFFGADGSGRTFLRRWGFPLFVVFVLILGRKVLLPFVFAGLIAYILAPVVRAMSERKDGTRRMPRGLAIIICYLVFIGLITGFLFLLVPRLSRDVARLGKELPGMYKKADEQWTPEIARWLEKRFPSVSGVKPVPPEPALVPDVPLPPGTSFTLTPLPDGRTAIQIAPNGVDVKPRPDGSYHIQAVEAAEEVTLDDKLRSYVKKGMVGLQGKLNDLVRLGQSLVTAMIRGVFLFFFTLMIAAFILIDMEKVHSFLRSLFPQNVRADYDVIIAGMDRGLSGVIRGQLLICLINGILTYIGLLIFGVKYSLILGVVAGLLTLIPIFGSILSSVPIVIVALVSGDHGIDVVRGLAIGLWIIGIHFIEANVLNPKIIGTAAKIHPVLVIFSLFLGQSTYGLVGALLAVPVLSAVQVVFVFLYRKTWKDTGRGRSETNPMLARTTTQQMPPPKT